MKNINVRFAALTAALAFALASQAGAQSMYLCLYYAPLQKQFASSLQLYQGVLASDDYGETWEQMFWETSRVNDIYFDPQDDDRYYLATDYGCFLSDDAGESWKQLTPMHLGTVFTVLLLDSQLWIATPKGPYTSDDGGDTWEARTAGLSSLNAKYTSDIIAVEEEVLAGKRTVLYIATADGVYSSADGKNWEPAGLQGHSIDNIESSPAAPELLAATSVLEGIWLRGKDFTWSFKAEELYSKKVQSVAFHPSDPETIYIGFRDFPVCKTTDGGAEWKTVNAGLTNNNVPALAFDPKDAKIVYAGTENGTFITRNAGERWETFSIRFGFVRAIRFKEAQQ